MCGRFCLTSSPDAIARLFDVPVEPALEPRFNIAPTQRSAVVREDSVF